MNIFSSTLTGHDQIPPVLDGLWARLQEVSNLAKSLDPNQLDEDDQKELEAIDRITHGYACFVLEAGAQLEAGEIISLEIMSEMSQVISMHCDDAQTALNHVFKLQSGLKRPAPVRVH